MSNWSDNTTEDQLLTVFQTTYTFKVMRCLMQKPMTVAELGREIKSKNHQRIFHAINLLQKKGLIKIKEYKENYQYNKVAVFTPTIKNLVVNLGIETSITSDTKLVLHSEGF